MKFTRLRIENFLTIGQADLNLADRGLVLLQGANEDDSSATSNGAGKSSIADALCWALYGITARGVSGDDVVNDTAGKDCRVTVDVTDGASHYYIARHRKHRGAKNSLVLAAIDGSTTTDLSKGTDKETQELVERVIGCSHDVFAAAVYCGQEQMPDLPGMTDRFLKTLIEQAAGIERLERAYEVARVESNDAEKQVVVATNAYNAAITTRTHAVANKDALETDHKTWQAGKQPRIDAERANLTTAQLAFKDAADRLKAMRKPAVIDAERAALRKQLDDHAKLDDVWNKANTAVVAAQRATDRRRVQIQNIEGEAAAVTNAIKNVDVEMAKPCGACGKAHTPAERADYLKHQKVRGADVLKRLGEARVTLAANEKVLAEARAAAAAAKPTPPQEAIDKLRALDNEHVAYQSVLQEANRHKTTAERLVAAIAAISAETFPGAASLARCDDKILEAQSAVVDAELKLEAAQINADEAKAAVKVFGPAGVRAHILDTVTPFLNERTAEYLSVLSDGNTTAVWTTLTRNKAGELKEKFSIDVVNSKGGKSFKGQSGGEKRKVRLACVLALQDLVAGRATKPIDLFMADEIDDALDSAGLERLMTVLEKRARERGTVLVVSHGDLRDWIDQVVVVTKAGGYSRVEGALCA
jgi:DNA repair exonuclease SbcCD ATPase subunit